MIMGSDHAIAIVGYGGIFPGADGPEQFWANIVGGVDSTTEVPDGRWLLAASEAFDPKVPRPDKVYATRGGFVANIPLDPAGLHLDPALVEPARPDVPPGDPCRAGRLEIGPDRAPSIPAASA